MICLGGGIGIRNRLKICRPYGIEGSSPSRGTKFLRAISSVGRAPRLHRGGRRFEPVIAHHARDVAQSGSASGLGPEGRGFKSLHPDQNYATVAQLVEQLICNQPVGGSSPLSGSIMVLICLLKKLTFQLFLFRQR